MLQPSLLRSWDRMSDIFPLDLTDGCKSLPDCERPAGFPQNGIKSRRTNFIYSKSLSFGSHDNKSLPRTSNSFSAAILFKDSRGLPVIQPLQSSKRNQACQQDDILNFFKCYKCYDLIPTSAKLVVLDTELALKKAFFAMLETGARAAPLWDSQSQSFVGLLTITHFVRILQKNYKRSIDDMETFEDQQLMDWKEITENKEELIHVSPDASLYEAVSLFNSHEIHRLPIIDPSNGNILYILNQKPLLRFLFYYVPNLQSFDHLAVSVLDAGVGTYNNVEVATETMTIIEAIDTFITKDISALPIVDKNARLLGIFSKFDVVHFVTTKSYTDLDISLSEVETSKAVYTCKGEDSVLVLMEKLMKAEVDTVVVVDESEKVVGVVTTSDIINYLVMRHTSNSPLRIFQPARIRQRREDSIGEEVELEDEESDSLDTFSNRAATSSSPPHWFNV